MSGNDSPTLILDCGSGCTKAGFAGEDAPRSVFPTIVGRHKPAHQYGCKQMEFVGPDAQGSRGILKLDRPIEDGKITDWDDMARIWAHVFHNELNVISKDPRVFITEAPLTSKMNREKTAQILFESFDTSALCMATSSVLSVIASGRETGLSVDCGECSVHIVPVVQGCKVSPAIQKLGVGGRELTEYLGKLLRQKGHDFSTSSELETVNDIKQKLCYVASDYEKELQTAPSSNMVSVSYELPDGLDISVGEERFRCPEALFQPNSLLSMLGFEQPGLHERIYESLQHCAVDIRKDLCTAVVLSGGSSMFQGLPERLTQELSRLMPQDFPPKIIARPERKYSAWIGASIMAELSSFKYHWVSKDEYLEWGPGIFHERI